MLNDAQTRDYQNEGFTVVPDLLTPGAVSALADEITAAISASTLAEHDATRLEMEPDQREDGTRIRRVYEPCHYYEKSGQLAESPEVLDCVEQLIGPHILLHYSKVNMKPAAIGSVVEWHQDLCYYPLTNSDSVAVLFYLDDASIENGCLQVLPGRHRAAPLDHTRNGFFQGRITEAFDASEAVHLTASAGSAIFMHCRTPHASAPNTSGKERRTLIISYRAADAFPIHLGETTTQAEQYVRPVRGEVSSKARFNLHDFPVPLHEHTSKSLYELQEKSRSSE